ncbi:hypothetical protein Tco_0676443 [Tanacetum coccineum]
MLEWNEQCLAYENPSTLLLQEARFSSQEPVLSRCFLRGGVIGLMLMIDQMHSRRTIVSEASSDNKVSKNSLELITSTGYTLEDESGLPIKGDVNCTLSKWKVKLLSIGGRSTLVKAVLGSVGIYYMSFFKVPESILSDIERLRAKYFWGGEPDSKLLIWIKWENVLASLEKGGLGIRSLKAFNPALLQKWRWRLVAYPNSLWAQVIKAIHGEEAGFKQN